MAHAIGKNNNNKQKQDEEDAWEASAVSYKHKRSINISEKKHYHDKVKANKKWWRH